MYVCVGIYIYIYTHINTYIHIVGLWPLRVPDGGVGGVREALLPVAQFRVHLLYHARLHYIISYDIII